MTRSDVDPVVIEQGLSNKRLHRALPYQPKARSPRRWEPEGAAGDSRWESAGSPLYEGAVPFKSAGAVNVARVTRMM